MKVSIIIAIKLCIRIKLSRKINSKLYYILQNPNIPKKFWYIGIIMADFVGICFFSGIYVLYDRRFSKVI